MGTSISAQRTTGRRFINWHNHHPSSRESNTSPRPQVQISASTIHPTAYQKRTLYRQAQRRMIYCQCTLSKCQRCRGSAMSRLQEHHHRFVLAQQTADLILRMVESSTHNTRIPFNNISRDKDKKALTYSYTSLRHQARHSQGGRTSQAEIHTSQHTHTPSPSPTHSSAPRQ